MDCFLSTGLDALVIHDWVITKRYLHKSLDPIFRFLVRVGRNLRSEALMERAAQKLLDS